MQKTRVWFLGWEDPLEKEWQPTPVFLPGKSHGDRSLAGYSPWGCKEPDTTGQLVYTHTHTHTHTHTICIWQSVQWPEQSFFYFLKVFLMWTILESLSNLLQYCFCFMFWCFGFEACGILAPWIGTEPLSPASKGKVLTTGLSGKSWRAIL